MTRATRIAAVVLAIAAIQAAAVLVYLRLDRGRRAPAPFTATALAGTAAPALLVERADGGELDPAHGVRGVRLVHFWATWGVPCRDELPALLARAAAVPGLELIAVSVDDDWAAVRAFFPGGVPREIARARARDAHRTYGARALPDTYVVTADGRLVERIAGARDWTAAPATAYLRALPGRLGDGAP